MTSHVRINAREKAASDDLNRLQALQGQDTTELERGAGGLRGPAEEDRSFVTDGLAVAPGASGLSVRVLPGGAVVQNPAGAPSDDLSSAELARLAKSVTRALAPAHATLTRFDLVEVGATSEVTESSSRDIYDPATGLFTPQIVPKVVRPAVNGDAGPGDVFVVTGTPAAFPVVPASTPGRIPLGAVRVGANAVSIAVGDVLDMRPLWAPSPLLRMHVVVDGLDLAAASLSADFPAFEVRPGAAMVDGQLVSRSAVQVVSTAGSVDPGAVPGANEWCYAYLFACRDTAGMRGRITAINNPAREGLVIISTTAPGPDGRPSAAVNFPTSGGVGDRFFAGESSTRGLYLGALKTGALSTNVAPFMRDGDWIRREGALTASLAGASPSTVSVDLAALAAVLPSTCRLVEVDLGVTFPSDPSTSTHTMRVRVDGGGYDLVTLRARPQPGGVDVRHMGSAIIPLGAAQVFDLRLEVSGAPDRWAGASLEVGVSGIHDPRRAR